MAEIERGAALNSAPGTYTNATVTVDAYGRVTTAAQGSTTTSTSTVTQGIMNTTGAALAKGQVVYFNSSTMIGTTPTVSLSIATAPTTAYSAGLVTTAVANNATGTILVQGLMTGLNTLALTQGAAVFVSPTTAGGLTSTVPVAPNYRFRVGYVTQSDLVAGAIYVTPSTGSLGAGTANQFLAQNSDASLQEMKTLAAGSNVVVSNAPGIVTFSASGMTLVPPIGYSATPLNVSAIANGAPVYQTEYFTSIEVGPFGWTADAFVFNLVTAYSGATIPTINLALHPSDPATGYPDTSSMIGTGTLAANSATGIKAVTFASAVALAPGRYWVGSLLAGAAVATAGALTCISGTGSNPYPDPSTIAPGTSIRSLTLTGQTALKATPTASSAFVPSGGSTTPVVNIRRSA